MRYFVPIFIYDQKLEIIRALKVLHERFTIGLHINSDWGLRFRGLELGLGFGLG